MAAPRYQQQQRSPWARRTVRQLHQINQQHQHHQQQQRQDFGYSRTVSYVTTNHLAVITQRWGSVHIKVMPFCLVNIIISITLVWLLQNYNIDLSCSEFGHEFMSILVSFLVIQKLGISLNLYYELQGYLATMNQSVVELTQLACSYTTTTSTPPYDNSNSSNNNDEQNKMWRHNVAFEALLLLKTTVAAIFKSGQEIRVWEIPELKEHPPCLYVERVGDIMHTDTHIPVVSGNVGGGEQPASSSSPSPALPKELYVWGHNLQSDLNLRLPIRMAQRLREVIIERRRIINVASSDDPMMLATQEHDLLQQVQNFMASYYGIRKYLTCPLPFPLVQLGRLFVMFYVFTLPFALLNPKLNLPYVQMIGLVGIMTYGFMGLELLFVEIDDPFAEDPNDLPLGEESRAAAEDVLLNIMHVDGQEAVEALRAKFSTTQVHDNYYQQVEANPPRLITKVISRAAKAKAVSSMQQQQQQHDFQRETDPLV